MTVSSSANTIDWQRRYSLPPPASRRGLKLGQRSVYAWSGLFATKHSSRTANLVCLRLTGHLRIGRVCGQICQRSGRCTRPMRELLDPPEIIAGVASNISDASAAHPRLAENHPNSPGNNPSARCLTRLRAWRRATLRWDGRHAGNILDRRVAPARLMLSTPPV